MKYKYNEIVAKHTPKEDTFKNIDFSMESLDSPVTAEVEVIYQKQPISADMTLGSVNDLMSDGKPPASLNTLRGMHTDMLVSGMHSVFAYTWQ